MFIKSQFIQLTAISCILQYFPSFISRGRGWFTYYFYIDSNTCKYNRLPFFLFFLIKKGNEKNQDDLTLSGFSLFSQPFVRNAKSSRFYQDSYFKYFLAKQAILKKSNGY